MQLARGDSVCNFTERTRSQPYRKGFLRLDRSPPKCSPKSKLCGSVCVPKIKRCKATAQLSNASSLALIQRKVEAEENKIKNLPHEHIVIIHPSTGEVLVHRTDNHPTAVSVRNEDIPKMRGAIVTHNHPNAYGYPPDHPAAKGFSLSDADMQTACMVQPKEIRAVSAGYRHNLSPGQEGWGDWNWKVQPVYRKHEQQVMDEYQMDLILGRKKVEQLEADYHHEVNTRVAKELGWNYERRAI